MLIPWCPAPRGKGVSAIWCSASSPELRLCLRSPFSWLRDRVAGLWSEDTVDMGCPLPACVITQLSCRSPFPSPPFLPLHPVSLRLNSSYTSRTFSVVLLMVNNLKHAFKCKYIPADSKIWPIHSPGTFPASERKPKIQLWKLKTHPKARWDQVTLEAVNCGWR